AKPGVSTLNLLKSLGLTTTAAEGPTGPMVLSPAPTDAANDPVDARFVVLPLASKAAATSLRVAGVVPMRDTRVGQVPPGPVDRVSPPVAANDPVDASFALSLPPMPAGTSLRVAGAVPVHGIPTVRVPQSPVDRVTAPDIHPADLGDVEVAPTAGLPAFGPRVEFSGEGTMALPGSVKSSRVRMPSATRTNRL